MRPVTAGRYCCNARRHPYVRVAFFLIVFVLIASPNAHAEAEPNLSSAGAGLFDWLFHNTSGGTDYLEALETLCQSLIQKSWTWASRLRDVIHTEGRAVATTLLLPVLTAEITFTGIRIMSRRSTAHQLMRFVLTTFLITVLLWPNGPGTIITGAMRRLVIAGKGLGQSILIAGVSKSAVDAMQRSGGGSRFRWDSIVHAKCRDFATPSQDIAQSNASMPLSMGPKELEPIYYWTAWIGIPPTRDELRNMERHVEERNYDAGSDPARYYKFSVPSLLLRIWHNDSFGKATGGVSDLVHSFSLLGSVFKAITDLLLVVTAIVQVIAAVTIAIIQIGATLMPVFTTLGILVGSILSFHVLYGLGIATLPLIYFRSFDKLWAKYLLMLSGIALIPFFFYVFSAIGYVFTVNLFEELFPLNYHREFVGLAQWVDSAFMSSVFGVLGGSSFFGTGIGQFLFAALFHLGEGLVYLAKLTAGSVLVSAFIFAGVSFAGIAPGIAVAWHRGFAADELIGRVGGVFDRVRDSAGSMIGSVYGERITRVGNFAHGVWQGAKSTFRG